MESAERGGSATFRQGPIGVVHWQSQASIRFSSADWRSGCQRHLSPARALHAAIELIGQTPHRHRQVADGRDARRTCVEEIRPGAGWGPVLARRNVLARCYADHHRIAIQEKLNGKVARLDATGQLRGHTGKPGQF